MHPFLWRGSSFVRPGPDGALGPVRRVRSQEGGGEARAPWDPNFGLLVKSQKRRSGQLRRGDIQLSVGGRLSGPATAKSQTIEEEKNDRPDDRGDKAHRFTL